MKDSNQYSAYNALKKDINLHNYRYHVLDDPLISDFEFDQMLQKLRVMESEHPQWIALDSPTQRSGAQPAKGFTRVTHPERILSLANAFSIVDLKKWYERISKIDERVINSGFVLEPKIDGLTVILHYANGIFVKGATRGNGEVGEDITQNIRTIPSVPLKIPVSKQGIDVPELLVVRAEAFIKIDDFERLNLEFIKKGERTYQNPRNTAAGSLRVLDSSVVAQRPLRILAYAIVSGNPKSTQWETLEYLKSLGFPVADISERYSSFDDMAVGVSKWEEYRGELNYEIDGVVVKINDLQMAGNLGFVGKDPRGAIALKFPAQEVTTELMDIRVNVGRTGVLTPYAVLSPVEIGGVIVKQATLHNFDFIREKDIRIGDRVLVKRAGEVIPYIIGPIIDVRIGSEIVYEPPEVCPSCGMKVKTLPGEVAWYCVNSSCPAQIIRNIEHFVSRGAMDIVGLGIKIVEQLVNEEVIKDVADLYAITKEDLLALEGFAEKKAENIIDAINTSKCRPLSNLITALGIHGIGEIAAETLASHYKDLYALSRVKHEEIKNIEGFGPNTAEAVTQWFSLERNKQVIKKLESFGVWPISDGAADSSFKSLTGMRFVITGTMREFTRDEIKNFIKTHGGKVSESVSGKTDYLVVGENPGSKLKKAKDRGVKVIDEGELKQITGADH